MAARVGAGSPAGRVNGSSGVVVRGRVLDPLGLDLNSVWLTDALPFFHVHRGQGTQGDAMSQRYDAFAAQAGLQPHDLPDRPTPAQLVHRAVTEEAGRLRNELKESQAPLLITLGNEALAVAAALLSAALPPKLTAGNNYGKRLPAELDGHEFEVLPLVHPGQRGQAWRATHDLWMAQQA